MYDMSETREKLSTDDFDMYDCKRMFTLPYSFSTPPLIGPSQHSDISFSSSGSSSTRTSKGIFHFSYDYFFNLKFPLEVKKSGL